MSGLPTGIPMSSCLPSHHFNVTTGIPAGELVTFPLFPPSLHLHHERRRPLCLASFSGGQVVVAAGQGGPVVPLCSGVLRILLGDPEVLTVQIR